MNLDDTASRFYLRFTLLDLCGLAVPASMRADGIPFGITLLAPLPPDLHSFVPHDAPAPV